MIVDLMPWLILIIIIIDSSVARIAVNETDWKYGPEVIYDIKVDSTSHACGQLQKTTAISNMTMKLKCRSKFNDALSCHFSEPKVIISTIKNFGKPQISKDLADVKKENIGDDIFELKYLTDDIEKIVVSSSIKEHKLDMIRALVAQLSLGAGVSAFSKHEFFERTEKFTIGWCPTDYLVSSRYVNDDDIKEEKNSYEIDTWPHGLIDKGEIKEIQRTRNIDKCKHHINYFFGSREVPKNSSIKFETEIKTSKSHMTVGRRIFNSYTENSIIVNTNVLEISTALTERITLNLEKIVPASGPLPTISDPSNFDIFPNKLIGIMDGSIVATAIRDLAVINEFSRRLNFLLQARVDHKEENGITWWTENLIRISLPAFWYHERWLKKNDYPEFGKNYSSEWSLANAICEHSINNIIHNAN